MNREVKIAMAGLAHGHGTGFLRDLLKNEGVSVVGFFDEDMPESAAAASEHFGAPVCSSLEELLDGMGANVFLTARVNYLKPEYCVEALRRGMVVVADKPLATDPADVDRLEQACRENPNGRLFAMFTERYVPSVYTAKKLVDSGAIGKVVNQYLVRPHRLRPEGRPAWMFDRSKYGGIINDIGVHDVDLARFFTGSEIKKVLSAHVANTRFTDYPDFCDNGTAMFELEDGSSATVSVNWLTPDKFPAHGNTRFFLNGTRGEIDIRTTGDDERKLWICSDELEPQYVELETPPLSCAEDALALMRDPDHKARITTADSINSTRAVMLAQSAAERI